MQIQNLPQETTVNSADKVLIQGVDGITRYVTVANLLAASSSGSSGSTDIYFSDVLLLLHGDGSTIVDSSSHNRSGTASGSISLSTIQSKFGGSSLLFGGGSLEYVSTDFNIGSGDCTIEFWLYTSNITSGQNVIDLRPASVNGNYPTIYLLSSQLSFAFNAIVINGSVSPTVNAWNYVALKKSGLTTSLWLNGTNIGSATTGDWASGNRILLGTGAFGVPYNGYIDDFRITTIARDVSVIPTVAFPNS